MTEDTKEALGNIAKLAPHWAALILLVVAFLVYLDRQAAAVDLVSRQRIETCHNVQDQATSVLSALVTETRAGATEDALLRETLEDYHVEIKQHNKSHETLRVEVFGELRAIHADLLEIRKLREAAR